MDDRNPYAPSHASLAARSSLPGGDRSGVTAWRNQKVLVMIPDSALPPRCVKCNEPAHEPTKLRKVYWHNPAVYLLILINIIIYAIVAAIVRKRARVAAGLCAAHKKRRRLALTFAWIGLLLGPALIGMGVADSSLAVAAAVGALVTLGGAIAGIVMARVVYAQKIDKNYVWLKGCGDPFLDSLPPLP
jgi:hypothetical protein